MLISGKWTLSQRILLDTRMTFHDDKRINAAGRYNNDKYMYLITELQNAWRKTYGITRRNRQIHNYIWRLQHLFLSISDKTTRQKVIKDTEGLYNTIDEQDLINIYGIGHPKQQSHSFSKRMWNIHQDKLC